jgi:hypothetical protein
MIADPFSTIQSPLGSAAAAGCAAMVESAIAATINAVRMASTSCQTVNAVAVDAFRRLGMRGIRAR